MTNKYMKKILFFAVSISLLSCNPAEDGFNAPVGSTVAFTDQPLGVDFPDTGVGCGINFNPDKLRMATFLVRVPIGTNGSGDPENSTGLTQPGNNIHGVITQNGGILLYRFKDGVKTFQPLDSLVDAVPGGTFDFVTDDRGLYSFVYQGSGCYNSDGDFVATNTSITVDVGVATGSLTYTTQ